MMIIVMIIRIIIIYYLATNTLLLSSGSVLIKYKTVKENLENVITVFKDFHGK